MIFKKLRFSLNNLFRVIELISEGMKIKLGFFVFIDVIFVYEEFFLYFVFYFL